MSGLVECVPNFSEGRDPAIVDRIVAAMTAVPGVRLLDRSMDPGHHRAVVTIIGSPGAVGEAAFRGVAEAAKLIDLRHHQGEHPRMGAADVVPFVPIQGVEMADCVALARQVGERIGRDLSIPVFLYEEAATRPERRNLADVRGPQFEGLRQLVGSDPTRTPDFGPNALHPSAGAVAVGARHLLVAYNVYLSTADQSIARAIARAVRHQTGGLRYVKALGVAANEAGRVHISMNLVNTSGTPIHRVVEMIRSEAARYGVTTVESEVVGLVSAGALLDAAEHYLQLNSFSRHQVLEYRLLEEPSSPREEGRAEAGQGTPRDVALGPQPSAAGSSSVPAVAFPPLVEETVAGYSARVASGSAVPGGGSVSALLGALSASLAAMVSRLTLGRRRFASVEDRMKEVEERAEKLRTCLLRLVDEDSLAYLAYMDAARRAKGGDPEAAGLVREAAMRATMVPMESARASLEAMELALEACRMGNPVARTDACVATVAGHAAVLGACLNVRVNLPFLLPDQDPSALTGQAAALEERAGTLLAEALALGRVG